MHSSHLRGSDFDLRVGQQSFSHAQYFGEFQPTRRLGLIAPQGIEGVGALTLVMASVTAFYDHYRASGRSFYAYPDFYSFQCRRPLVSYAMFDIWPDHKDVFVEDEPAAKLTTLVDRGINLLLLPAQERRDHEFHPALLESARRNIDSCYLYDMHGVVDNPTVTINSGHPELAEWGLAVLDTHDVPHDRVVQALRSTWQAQAAANTVLCQTFRAVSLEEALTYL